MAFKSSHTPWELAGIHPACATSDPPFVCMQDIIDHEYALVESIPNEERAALMPIIRFVRNTLQDPFTALHHCRNVDALKLADTARMQILDNHHIDTNYRFHKEVEFLEKRELQGPHSEDAKGEYGASMSRVCGPKTNNSHCLESCKVHMPWERPTSRHSSQDLYQQKDCQGAHHQKEAQNFDSLLLRNHQLHYSKHDNQANPIQPHRGGFILSSLAAYRGLGESNSLTFKIDSESNINNICSKLDMDSLNLEELRSRLRPPARDMDGDGNCSDGVNDEDDKMHEKDENHGSYLYYPNQDEEQDTSDVEWPMYWGSSMHHHQTTTTDDHFRFPKVHCRRRNVTKKAVGWIKKRAAQFLVSRVRHKRKCNLPCCTDCEIGTKKRKASGYGSRKCARLSTTKQIAASLTATPENAARSNRMSNRGRTAYGDMASSESCDDQEVSQVTQDSDNSPLATALAMVLMNAKGHGLTSCEALQALIQEKHFKANNYEHQALASHVKTTLKKCALFEELKNHRFILKAGQKLASSSLHGSVHDQKFSERNLPLSQLLYKKERSLSQIVDQSLSRLPCQQDSQCHKTDRNKPGFSWSVHHLQLRAVTSASGCSSCEVIDSCDAPNERRQGAKEGDMLATIVDSCSGQSTAEKDQYQDRAEAIRCCRTDGKSWQCSNQAQEGSIYCGRHQSRSKKGMVTRHVPVTFESKEKGKLQTKELTAKNQCVIAHERKLSMQLRPRSGAAHDICLQKL